MKLATSNRDLARLNYDWCQVRASTSGRLSRRMVDPGIWSGPTIPRSPRSSASIPCTSISTSTSRLFSKIQRLVEQGKVKARSLQAVPVQISLSDEEEDEFPHTGLVDFTDNKVDINTGTLRFRAKLENKDHFIVPGLVVRVRLPIGDSHPAVFIRKGASLPIREKKVSTSSASATRKDSRSRTPSTRKESRFLTIRSRSRRSHSGRRSAIPACRTTAWWKSRAAFARATGWS